MYTSNISTRVIAEHWRCPKITRDLALKKIINEEKEKDPAVRIANASFVFPTFQDVNVI